jgi:glycosyltransferase involved in cell wall biosynthesis
MNIAFVSNVVYPFVMGGAEKRIHEIGTRLADQNHEITVYARHFWDGPPETKHADMTLRAVSPERELYTSDRRSITEALEFSKDIIRPLQKNIHEHDIIVASVFPYFPVLASKLTTIPNSIPLVTTWHEVWQDYWTEYLGYLAPFGRIVEHLTARVPQHPVAVSEVTADQLSKIGPSRDQISVVPNGIDIGRVQSVTPAENGFDILFAGRLISDKHVDRLLHAFDRIASDHDVTLGIIGDGPERDNFEQEADVCRASDRVSFLGFFHDYENVLAHMKSASIFAIPSTREGFGITYLEAMAADCVVIGVDHPNSAAGEVINDAGYVVDPTVDGLAKTLDRVLTGERPPKDPLNVANQYDWDIIAEQAEKAYRSAIGE